MAQAAGGMPPGVDTGMGATAPAAAPPV